MYIMYVHCTMYICYAEINNFLQCIGNEEWKIYIKGSACENQEGI